MDRDKKTLANMSFKQQKKEWENARKRLDPENEYLRALVENIKLKLEHKRLVDEFEEEYAEEIEDIRKDPEIQKKLEKEKKDIKEGLDK